MSMKEVQLQEISTYSILSDSKQELEKTQHNKYDVDIENARSRCSRDLSPNTKDDLRLRVNARERERMHVINGAMDALRQVMPYGNGPSMKKLSKMSTILLARNYILNLTKNTEHLKLCVARVCMEQRKPIPPVVCAGPVSSGFLPGSVGLMGSSLDLPTHELSPLTISQTLPMCTPASLLPGLSVGERAAMYRKYVSPVHPIGKETLRPMTLHTGEYTQAVKSQPLNHTGQHSDFTKSYRCEHSSKSNVFSSDVTFADSKDSTYNRQFGEYPEQRSDIHRKMKCKSRSGKSCFCVECLTKK